MAENIYDDQPCYWTTNATTSLRYPSDTIGGAAAATRAASVFNGTFRNARIQTVVFTPAATGHTVTVQDDAGNVIGVFKAGGTETHSWDIGGDVGVLAVGGFKFSISNAGSLGEGATIFWRHA